MKHFNLLLAAMLLSAASACEKGFDPQPDSTDNLEIPPAGAPVSAPLRFSSIGELEDAIRSGGDFIETRSPGFVSFAQTQMCQEGYEDDDNAVFSEAFGKVLNGDGKVIFDDVLVKVGKDGILYGPVGRENEIDSLAAQTNRISLYTKETCPYLPEGTRSYGIREKDGIYIVDSFDRIGDSGNPGKKEPENPKPVIELPLGPVCWGNDETIIGGAMDNDYTKPRGSQKNVFASDENVANDTKIYKQDYGVYSETGVKTKTMRKKGLVWNKFECEVTSAVTDICIREMGNRTLAEKGSGWIDVNNTHYKGKSYQIATIVVGSPNALPTTNSQLLKDISNAQWWFSSLGAEVPPIDGVRYIVKGNSEVALTRIKDEVVTKVDSKNTLILNLKTHQNQFYTDKGIMGQLEIKSSWYMVDIINFYGYSTYNNARLGSILRCRRL